MFKARFTTVTLDDETVHGPDWAVTVSPRKAILYGFARQIDAEIAIRFLQSLPITWSRNSKFVWDQLKSIGIADRNALMEAACERLRW